MSDNAENAVPVAWKGRVPTYKPHRAIHVPYDLFETLNAMRGGETWTQFLARLANVPPPRDRRFNAPNGE